MSVLSLDPGKTSGWALWSEDGKLLEYGNAVTDDMLERMSGIAPELTCIVAEDFRLYKHKAVQQAGSPMEAVQIIGAAKMLMKQNKGGYFAQPVSAMTIAILHSGLARVKNHSEGHWMDAILHGYLFWEKRGVDPDVSALVQ